MCIGREPEPPEIKYVGPSEEDIQRQEERLDAFEQQIGEQVSTFNETIQQRIDAGVKETEGLKKELRGERQQDKRDARARERQTKAEGAASTAEAASNAQTKQVGALTVTTIESEPEQAQTTEPIKKKKKPASNLKISAAGTPSSAGSGLNIGV